MTPLTDHPIPRLISPMLDGDELANVAPVAMIYRLPGPDHLFYAVCRDLGTHLYGRVDTDETIGIRDNRPDVPGHILRPARIPTWTLHGHRAEWVPEKDYVAHSRTVADLRAARGREQPFEPPTPRRPS